MGAWKRLITSNDFTDTQIQDLQDLVFTSPTVSLTKNKPSFEKGVSTTIDFYYSTYAGDDTWESANIIYTNGNIAEENVSTSGTHTATGLLSSVQRKYRAVFDIEGTKTSSTATSTAITPQYVGISTDETFDDSTYSNIGGKLTKFLSTQNYINSTNVGGTDLANSTIGFTAENHYIYFISKNSGLTVYDQTNLPQSMVTEFLETTISVKLADGTDQTMYQYRSAETKDFSTETGGQIGYKLESA